MQGNRMRTGIERGEPCAMLCASAAEVKKWQDLGALLLAYSSDTDILHSGFSRAMAELIGSSARR